MASDDGNKKNGGKKSRPLRYFFLNGQLHKSIHKNRSTDTIITWCYPTAKRVAYTYSDVRKRMQKAFTTAEVSEMVKRVRLVIELAIINGHIEEPQYIYTFDSEGNKSKSKYMWREEDIMALREYLSTVHIGRPRKDGLITASKNLPSERELRAIIRQQPVMGYLDNEGNFIPTWLAEDL